MCLTTSRGARERGHHNSYSSTPVRAVDVDIFDREALDADCSAAVDVEDALDADCSDYDESEAGEASLGRVSPVDGVFETDTLIPAELRAEKFLEMNQNHHYQ